jgi:aminoglycoside N3'-acetyltransferase
MANPAEAILNAAGAGPVLAHVDLLQVIRLVKWRGLSRTDLLRKHAELLQAATGGRSLWMPAFNYDYPKTGRFDVRQSSSHVGHLTEFFRVHVAQWRTPVPMFSLSGVGTSPEMTRSATVDPFSSASAFADLRRHDGTILFYGAPFASCTAVHHVERLMGQPPYRYDKSFLGEVIGMDGRVEPIELRTHVRPWQRNLGYDWEMLLKEAQEAGLIIQAERNCPVFGVRARPLFAFWNEALKRDPLHLLDAESRAWVQPMLQRLGRAFRQEDFETPQAG